MICGVGSETSGEIPRQGLWCWVKELRRNPHAGIFWVSDVLMSHRLPGQHCWIPTNHTNPGTIPKPICYVMTAWTVLANYTIVPEVGGVCIFLIYKISVAEHFRGLESLG
jgi:hypothetical protein